MSIISATSLSKSYGHEDIFSGLSFSVARGSRLALVGPNGVGKTTLLRILVGEEEASSGQVSRTKNIRIGYLPQEAEFESDGTVWDECLGVFAELIRLEQQLNNLEADMSDPAKADKILPRYGKLQEKFELQGGYTYQQRIRQVLSGLGFAASDFTIDLSHLSGGQRTRAFLARLLLSSPDLLLLDEPTNHLDIAAVEWLEGYLSRYEGAVVIVSHDRYFLDRVANVILEMHPAAFELYNGNYSAYLHQRQERAERRQQLFEGEKEKLLKDVFYIKKNISGQNTLQAKGKLKRLTRIVQAIEQAGMETVLNSQWSQLEVETTTSPFTVEEAERRVRALKSPVRTLPRLHLQLGSRKRSGNLVIRSKDLQIGYPGRLLFSSPDIELRRRECAALIGPNGAGKTTFLKTILEQHQPYSGEVILGASLQIGYFAQAHEGLDPEKTLMQEIDSVAPHMLPGQVREYLGKYIFSGDDAFKKVGVLSGGERGRLALAKLALQDTNLLLLDEPTNHLDIPSQEVLQAVLDDYKGTILLVTHDRYLIDALATQIWEIREPAGAKPGSPDASPDLEIFQGAYSQLKEERARQAEKSAVEATARSGDQPGRTHRGRSAKDKTERRRIAQVQEIENRIVALEVRLNDLGKQLENPPDDPARVVKLGEEYIAVQKEMDEMLLEWEGLQ
ncbi:MAG: ABC-F family ATP-binding cassette domain-containing protein [Anaerolineales bacterium]|nr:ABC-F family ATP-binding cassette domain-containing protein [Anaerolineales bacterium]